MTEKTNHKQPIDIQLSDKFFWHGYIPFYEIISKIEISKRLLNSEYSRVVQSDGYWSAFLSLKYLVPTSFQFSLNGLLMNVFISDNSINRIANKLNLFLQKENLI